MTSINIRKLASDNIERVNPLLLPLPWLIVLVLVIIFATMKYSNNDNATPPTTAAEKTFPHIFITDVEMRQFDQQGGLHYQLNTPLIRHYQEKEHASKLDYTLFDTPVFVLVDDPKQPAWIITAQEGRRENNGLWVTLSKDVLARQTSATQGETTFTTEELQLNTQEQFAETSKAVTMRAAKSQIDAMGLRADIKRNHVELLSHVKGTYEP